MTTAIEKIDQKFLASGHSFLPNDSDFGMIERMAVKHVNDIYVPELWFSLIARCKRERAFQANRMKEADFMSVSELSKFVTVGKVDDNGNKIEWLKIQHIQVCKKSPLKMFYKYSVQDDVPFNSVSFVRKGRPLKPSYSLKSLYGEPRPLSAEKASDLRKLLKYVPPLHHVFFNKILGSSAARPALE